MKLENQVCSLELSKQLKKLGVKQKSLWYWGKFEKPYDEWHLTQKPNEYGYTPCVEFYSAFTVAELGEILGTIVDKPLTEFSSGMVDKYPMGWWCEYQDHDDEDKEHTEYADTEANARAKMLIYLKENKLL